MIITFCFFWLDNNRWLSLVCLWVFRWIPFSAFSNWIIIDDYHLNVWFRGIKTDWLFLGKYRLLSRIPLTGFFLTFSSLKVTQVNFWSSAQREVFLWIFCLSSAQWEMFLWIFCLSSAQWEMFLWIFCLSSDQGKWCRLHFPDRS